MVAHSSQAIVKPGSVDFEQSTTRPDISLNIPDHTSQRIAASEEAITAYVNAVGNSYTLPETNRRFFAYLFTMRSNTIRHSFDVSKNAPADLEEGLNIAFGSRNVENGLFDLAYAKGRIDLTMFPEYHQIMQRLNNTDPQNSFSNNMLTAYSKLMRIPPIYRTFFAGLLYEKCTEPGQMGRGSNVALPVSTLDILAYAEKMNISDVKPYMMLISEMMR